MTFFDKDGGGEVEGGEFLNKFFSLAREEQKKLLPKKERPKSRLGSPPKKVKKVMVSIGVQAFDDDHRPVSSPEKMPLNYVPPETSVGTSNEDDRAEKAEAEPSPFGEPVAAKLKKKQEEKEAKEAAARRVAGERPKTVGLNKAGVSRIASRSMTAPAGKKRSPKKKKSMKKGAPGSATPTRHKVFDEWEEKIEEEAKLPPVFFFPSLMLSPIAMPSLNGSKILR